MNPTYLITGTPSPVLSATAVRLLEAGAEVFALLDEAPQWEIPEEHVPRFTFLPANPRSPIAVRSFILGLANTDRRLDYAIHIHEPDTSGKTLAETGSGTIDRTLDRGIKGLVYPLREVLGAFSAQKKGSLAVICVGPTGTAHPPLEAAVFGAIQELGRSLFNLYQNEPFSLRGILASADMRTAQIVSESLDMIRADSPKTRCRWNKLGGRPGIFGLKI